MKNSIAIDSDVPADKAREIVRLFAEFAARNASWTGCSVWAPTLTALAKRLNWETV